MNTPRNAAHGLVKLTLALLASAPFAAIAQTPVDDDGKVIGAYEPAIAAANEGLNVGDGNVPLMSAVDLEELVGPIALYPDSLLAVILPAAAYPQQIIEAARFLKALEDDASLKPDSEWDDSIVALLNYPEVVELLNDDIDWTWRLGEAVVAQQPDVVTAIEAFRDRAYNAGNLKSDEYQNVVRNEDTIEITPVADDVIYVPYYEPERVVVYQPRPVYYYYPRSYPVYYYPYSSAYHFDRGFFWGVTTAFSIGWFSDSLHVHHHSYHGHPYYGRHYWDRWWYRRPTMNVYHNHYGSNTRVTVNRYNRGDQWRPRDNRRDYVQDSRGANNRYTARRDAQRQDVARRHDSQQRARTQTVNHQEPIAFRDRRSDQAGRTQDQRSDQRSQSRQGRSDEARRQSQDYVARQDNRGRDAASGQNQRRQEPRDQTRQQRREQPPQVQQQRREQRTTPVAQQRERHSAPPPQQREQRATPQRQQRSAPPPQQRQQRSAPPPQQRQQRSAPPPQQRQQRSAPPPQQRQQRSSPPPQQRSSPPPRQRSESRSSDNRSQERRSNRR